MILSYLIRLFILLTAIASTNISARQFDLGDGKTLDLSGYAGWMQINSSTELGSHIKSQPELGLLMNLQLGPTLQVFNQFTYGQNADQVLVYNFVAWTPHIFDDLEITMRGGRLRHEYGWYNALRVNPRTRPGVLAPQSIYWNELQQILTSGNGVNISFKWKGLELTYTIDDPVVMDPVQEAFTWSAGSLNKINTKFGSHQMLTATYELEDIPLAFRFNYVSLNFGNDRNPYLNYPQDMGKDFYTEFMMFGIKYEGDGWSLSGEALELIDDGEWTDWKDVSYGYSFTGTYDLDENWTLRANFNAFQSNFLQQAGAPKPATQFKDTSLGLNWHDGNWMVGVDVHYFQGGITLDIDKVLANPRDYENNWMVATNVVYFFD